MYPKHREENLIVKRIGDEVIVYDMTSDRVHSLNGTAGAVFELCDGTIGVPELAERLGEQQAATSAVALAIVTTALEQLSDRGLLEQSVERVTGEQRVSRRHLLRQIARTAVAIPVIISLTAPWPTEAGSTDENGKFPKDHPCSPEGANAKCASGFCLGGFCS